MNDESNSDISQPQRSRLAKIFLSSGTDPDPRFTLANERTYLAWIRTSLAFLAAGIALEVLSAQFMGYELRKVISVVLITLSMLIGGSACIRWLNVERAMRAREPLPFPALIPGMSIVLLLLTVVLIVRAIVV